MGVWDVGFRVSGLLFRVLGLGFIGFMFWEFVNYELVVEYNNASRLLGQSPLSWKTRHGPFIPSKGSVLQ